MEGKLTSNLYVLNGPNLNLLGKREPKKYGGSSIENIKKLCQKKCSTYNLNLHFFQSNFEGDLIEEIHKANNDACGIIINAGALTHTSIGILDALNMYNNPIIEIHITNIYSRESFRHKSYISPVATGIIAGLGINSYLLAIDAIKELMKD